VTERDDQLVGAVRGLGLPATRVLGSGMEGAVVELADPPSGSGGQGEVVKVWHRRSGRELRRLQSFYAAVAAAGLPFGVARILEVLPLGDRWATRQVRLEGDPLWDRPGVSPPLDEAHVDALVDVLAALAAVDPVPAMAALPVLEGEAPFDRSLPFGHSLAALVERRAARAAGPLRSRLPDLEGLVSAVTGQLRSLPPTRTGLVHGDLVPGNVLARGGSPTAVLDFGFLSTVGDPAFDAAVAASVQDMYGPDARRVEERLDAAVTQRLGHDRARLHLYRAAYALTTATCFSPSGSDGHFAWCVAMLERPDVRADI
jgi:aminoglycoside phosphotransferase (APT) family kinase protein